MAIEQVSEGGLYVARFLTNDSTGAPVAPSAAFVAADYVIWKDDNAAEKATTNGLTSESPFDTQTGVHQLEVDTSVDTGDAGFWEPGSKYEVWLIPSTTTVDGIAVKSKVGEFQLVAVPQVYYVDTAGSNSNDGSSGSPWLTISYALGQISDGDKVIVNDGTYSEAIVANGEYDTGVTIESANRHGAKIQNPSGPRCWEFDGGASKGWTLRGFEMQPKDAEAAGTFVRFDDDCENITLENLLLTEPADQGSTANSFQNGAAVTIDNIVIRNCEGDLGGRMGFIRFTGDARNIYIQGNDIQNHAGGIDLDDCSGVIEATGNVTAGTNRSFGIRTPVGTAGESPNVRVVGNDFDSTSGSAIRVDGSDAWQPYVIIEDNKCGAGDSGVVLNEYIAGGKVNGNSISASASPGLAIAADGFTGPVGRVEVLRNHVETTTGHGAILGYMCSGGFVQFNTFIGENEGLVIKGQNITARDNYMTALTGAACLIKGGTNVCVTKNTMRVSGVTGDHIGLDVREQDAGTYAQRDPDELHLTENTIYVSGSGSVGYQLAATNIGNNIYEDSNVVLAEDSATAASIIGTAVTTTSEWNAAYSGYAETRNGLFSSVNETIGAAIDDIGNLNDPTVTAIADAILSRGVSNTEGTADRASLTELILAAFESVRTATTWTIYQTDHATPFGTRTITQDANLQNVKEVN